MKHIPSGGGVLEVGCGDGELLVAIQRIRPDLRVIGVDLQFTEDNKRDLEDAGVECIESAMEEAELSRSYDLVIMNQLIEHLWDVRGCLQSIHKCLGPEGRVSISTPNLEGWDRRWCREGTWGGYYFPRHLNLFTPASLDRLLRDCGLETVVVRELVAPVILVQDVHNACRVRNMWIARFMKDTNVPLMAFATVVDILAKLLRRRTSNMQIIACRERSGAPS